MSTVTWEFPGMTNCQIKHLRKRVRHERGGPVMAHLTRVGNCQGERHARPVFVDPMSSFKLNVDFCSMLKKSWTSRLDTGEVSKTSSLTHDLPN